MGIDILDLFRLDAGVRQGLAHDPDRAVRSFRGGGDVERISRHAIAYNLRQDAPMPEQVAADAASDVAAGQASDAGSPEPSLQEPRR